MPNCPHCSSKYSPITMSYEGTSKITGARRYHCKTCGQHYIKSKGSKTYRRGQF